MLALDFSLLPDVSRLHPELAHPGELEHAAHMLARERAIHAVFGETFPADQVLSPDDPRLAVNWPGGCLLRFAPLKSRTGWHYVSHGLCQPEERGAAERFELNPDAHSGFGVEFIISVPADATWAPRALLQIVKYVLFQDGAGVAAEWGRLAIGQPIGGVGRLDHLLVVRSPDYETDLILPGGHCRLLHLVGTTALEMEWARKEPSGLGSQVLAEILRQVGIGCLTIVERACITSRLDFVSEWERARRTVMVRQNAGL